MPRAFGIRVLAQEAEATRRRLQAEGMLRTDLKVAKDGDAVVFPVHERGDAIEHDFETRAVRPRDYAELLPEAWRADAPRAHDVLGDIVIIKVPQALWAHRGAIGAALQDFHGARAVFHDHGVVGEFRVRDLERIAGEGGSQTQVAENGVRLHVDPGAAYFSPRLGDERARMTALCLPLERVVDLFGGVAPLGVQLAKKGCEVVSVDLNPAACDLARQNAEANGVDVEVRNGDAREVARDLAPALHVVMNLPHGAKHFLDVAAGLVAPAGWIHHHEIMRKEALTARQPALVAELAQHGRPGAQVRHVRHVRDYSTDEAHFAFDIEVP